MRQPLRYLLAASALVIASACTHKPAAAPRSADTQDTGTPDVDTGGTDSGVAIADFCRVVATATCDAVAGCRCAMEGSVTSCAAAQQALCERALEASFAGVALGVLRYDAARARRCLDDYRSSFASCANPGRTPSAPSCGRMFVDTTALGGNCPTLGEGHACASGAGVCDPSTLRCVALPVADAACVGGLCAEGLVCDDGMCRAPGATHRVTEGLACGRHADCTLGLACVRGLCAKPAALGDVCEMDSGACGPDGLCRPPTVARTCQPKLGAGGRCERFDDCASGLFCMAFVVPGVCSRITPDGAMCHSESVCQSGSICAIGTNRCTPLPTLGQACLGDWCAARLACEGGICAAGGDVGASCWASVQCRSGLACDRVTRTCAHLGSNGESCVGGDELCDKNAYCRSSDQTCRPSGAQGASCTTDRECLGDLVCDGGSCEPIPDSLGAPCDRRCGGSLYCAPMQGTCVGAVCALVE